MLGHINTVDSFGITFLIRDEKTAIAAGISVPKDLVKKVKNEMESKDLPVTELGNPTASVNFSNMSIVGGKGSQNPKMNAIDYFMVSNKASSKTGDIHTQYFLVRRYDEKTGELRNIDDMKEEIKIKFFKFNMPNLPIPIEEDWNEFFWDEIKENLTILERNGSEEVVRHPMDGFKLALPDLAYLQNKVEKVHAKSEFQQYYKRVPEIDSLLTIADIKGWKKIVKNWGSFFKMIGGKDELLKKSEDEQKTIIRSFELFLDSDLIMKNLEYLHSAGLRPLTIDIREMGLDNDQAKMDRYRSALKKILEHYSGKKEVLITLLNNFSDLFEHHAQNIRVGNWDAIKKYLETIIYDNVHPRCRDLAITCGKAKVAKTSWKKYEEEYLDNIDTALTAAKTYPTISKDVEGTKVMWETMDMSEPAAWVVGIETYCCQHLDNVGGACVRYAARNPETSGIFKVSEKGRTLAQSFFWLQESSVKGEYIFVLDNIEVAGNELKDSVIKAYIDFAKEMKKYAPLFRIRAMTVGTQYTTLSLKDIAPKTVDPTDANYASKPSSLAYSDARNQKLVREYKINKGKE